MPASGHSSTRLLPESATSSVCWPCSATQYGQQTLSRAAGRQRLSPLLFQSAWAASAQAFTPSAVNAARAQASKRELAVSATTSKSPATVAP